MDSLPLTLGILVAVLLHMVSRRLPMWGYIVVSLPGTLLHELSHWLFAFILRAKPSLPSIIPRRDGNLWYLGSVDFQAKWYSASVVALAPLIVLFAIASIVLTPETFSQFQSKHQFKWTVALLWFGPALLPSRADWSIVFEFPFPFILTLGLATLYFF